MVPVYAGFLYRSMEEWEGNFGAGKDTTVGEMTNML
jgi:hypothetical protein